MGGRGGTSGRSGGGTKSSYSVPIGKKVDFYKALGGGNGKVKYVKATGETFSSNGRVFGIEKASGLFSVTDTKTGLKVSDNHRTRKAAIASVSDFNSRISKVDKDFIRSHEKSMQTYYSRTIRKKK